MVKIVDKHVGIYYNIPTVNEHGGTYPQTIMKSLFLLPTHLFNFLMPFIKGLYRPSSELVREDEQRIRNVARRATYEAKKVLYTDKRLRGLFGKRPA